MPYYSILKKPSLKYAYGYTCLDHACLYYTAIKEEKEWINYIDDLIENGDIINTQNVERAKVQVINECIGMEKITIEREKIVRFVTENRIGYFAMGKIDEISKITYKDVEAWLNDIKRKNIFYKIRFNEKREIQEQVKAIIEKDKLAKKIKISECIFDKDMVLHINEIEDKKCTIDLYFKINNILSIEESIIKEFILCYLQYLCQKYFHTDTYVKEKYFTYSERYIVITVIDITVDTSNNTANKLRRCLEKRNTVKELFYYKKFFYKYIKEWSLQDESNEDWINKFYNYVLYDIPIFDLKNVLELADVIDERIFEHLDYITHQPIKIVIKNARKSKK
ncbi:hypothetical protein CDLVIII_5695 [Clostridium sp. DL-VIII]|uniref:hypothetical protein n=1 Tax=Clostridium sp. DL-VIII TaxID=641107 RepID=UPI00023B07EC|nr:hypothetical protein [Clostridium sp. DL-VIII]EHJ02165.1 hypothetical protein CDLVIII_5695 [Clostridium sp. DL-VIII]